MAAAICTSLVAQGYPEYIDKIKILSAGCAAMDGSPAAPEAVTAMAAKGLAIKSHRARQIDKQLLAEADLVVTMGEGHLRRVTSEWPWAAEKTYTLRELADEDGDVIDPLGRGSEFYQQTGEELERLLRIMLKSVLGEPEKMD